MKMIIKKIRDNAMGILAIVAGILILAGLPFKAFGTESLGFIAGIALTAIVYWHASRRPQGPAQSSPELVRPVRLETGHVEQKGQAGPYDELRLKHCAIMMGINEGDAVTYLIPCIGNVSRSLEAVPTDGLSTILESAARLRENGIQVKVLIPDGHISGTAFFPAVSKYTVGVRQFPVPKAFFSGN
jgi:hypothetical protein